MKKLLLLTCLLLSVSCLEDWTECEPDSPCEDMTWVDAEVKQMKEGELTEYFYISQGVYQSQTVFIFNNCCPMCDTTPPPVYTCDGVELGMIGVDVDLSEISDLEVFWRPDNLQCNI